MSEAVDQHELCLTPFDMRPVGATVVRADRQFNIALVVATVVHVLFLTSFLAADVRQLGDPGGAADGISVEIVTEADLKSMGTVADTAAGPPAPPAPPPPQPQQTAAPPPPPQQTASLPPAPPAEPPAPEPQAQPEPVPSPPAPEPQAQPKEAPPEQAATPPESPLGDERLLKIPSQAALPHSLEPPKPPEPAKPVRPEEARPPQPKQRQRTTALDLTVPPSVFMAPSGGGGAGIERPAGITRSGENDAFARGVIAALQRSMPQLRDTYGRVTVRIKLDKDGSLVGTEVIRPSSVAGLDQNVVFSTRQSSFPFPPRNANAADLTFLVTYIYR